VRHFYSILVFINLILIFILIQLVFVWSSCKILVELLDDGHVEINQSNALVVLKPLVELLHALGLQLLDLRLECVVDDELHRAHVQTHCGAVHEGPAHQVEVMLPKLYVDDLLGLAPQQQLEYQDQTFKFVSHETIEEVDFFAAVLVVVHTLQEVD